ncbi:MAG: hypothetical protein KME16_12500 [Scytolyngbya sp. HA4215-MV1]|jgi:hypothetical protein|nr:hypothetical protein [Scytolyngbya sp. HA4215-MV1]
MKTIDQIYRFQIPGHTSEVWKLQCRLRIFQSYAEVQTVLIADMAFEIGWFNPSIVEKLVDQVVQVFDLDPSHLVWIEQYASEFSAYADAPSADFSQVTFEWQDGKATNPQWTAIAPEVAQKLIHEDLQLLPA